MKTKILDRNEREALCVAYKQFANLAEIPDKMDLYSTSGHYLGKLTYLTTKEYPLKRDGILFNASAKRLTIEFCSGKNHYEYEFERRVNDEN